MQRGLAGRVAAADDVHVLVLAKDGFARAGAVIDAGALQPLLVGQAQPPVVDAGRAEGSAGDDLGAVGEIADAFPRQELTPDALAVEKNFRPEMICLLTRAFGQLRAADPLGEPEIILDLGTGPGLSAQCGPLDQHGLEAFGSAIDGGAEPSRAAAIDG